MKVLILGEGRSALAASNLLKAKGHEVVCGGVYDLAVVSPGIPLDDPRCKAVRAPLIGEMELGLRHLSGKAIGVTGTNGKTTTALMCAFMLNASGKKAIACGNNGYALCQAILDHPDADVFVIEMSSYQLETSFSKVLDAAVVLNVTPDHLDRYEDFAAYRDAKMRIQDLVKPGGKFYQDLSIEEASQKLSGLDMSFAKGFIRPAHRLEFIAKVNGIDFVNDSKATNVESALHAVKTLDGPLIVLAGGLGKGADFTAWQSAFSKSVKKVIVFGDAASAIENALGMCVDVEQAVDLQSAVKKAFQKASIGDTIVLSPGCSSFDQFRDFEERGEVFKICVKELQDES